MKADPFVQLRLLDLQALDSIVDRLAHQRRTLPALADITRLDGFVASRRWWACATRSRCLAGWARSVTYRRRRRPRT